MPNQFQDSFDNLPDEVESNTVNAIRKNEKSRFLNRLLQTVSFSRNRPGNKRQ